MGINNKTQLYSCLLGEPEAYVEEATHGQMPTGQIPIGQIPTGQIPTGQMKQKIGKNTHQEKINKGKRNKRWN